MDLSFFFFSKDIIILSIFGHLFSSLSAVPGLQDSSREFTQRLDKVSLEAAAGETLGL